MCVRGERERKRRRMRERERGKEDNLVHQKLFTYKESESRLHIKRKPFTNNLNTHEKERESM